MSSMKKAIAILMMALLHQPSISGGLGGALGGMGAAMEEIGRQNAETERQLEIIKARHEAEMALIQFQYEMQRRLAEEERARRAARAQEVEKENKRADDELRRATEARRVAAEKQASRPSSAEILEAIHPNWKAIVTSIRFERWSAKLTANEQKELESSDDPYLVSEYLWRYKKTLTTAPTRTVGKQGERKP